MGRNFPPRWIFPCWMVCILVAVYAQSTVSKAVQCGGQQYMKGSRCCDKCKPGSRVFADCTESHQTKCVKCARGEYQPFWTQEMRCLQQRICDEGKGFMSRIENLEAEEPCRCPTDSQCSPINCEFCEKIPPCRPGYGLEVEPESIYGRKVCVPCKKGFFSADNDTKQCKQWTNCKAEGRSETRPGSAQADAVCGPPVSGAAPSWVIVSLLLAITVLCLLILLLFCYKDKLKLLSVNLRSCVQNLKRTRIQQETLAPLYQSGAAGGLKYVPCETTKLFSQPPRLSDGDDPPCTLTPCTPAAEVSLPQTQGTTTNEGLQKEAATKEQSEGSSGPEEVSEEEELTSVPSPLPASCICSVQVREPLEVGENEDCSQAVSPGTLLTCSCGGLRAEEKPEEKKIARNKAGHMTKSETSIASLVSFSPPLLRSSSVSPPSSSVPELCMPLSKARSRPEFKGHLKDMSPVKQKGYCRLESTDSSSTDNCGPSAMTSVGPLKTSSSIGDLYSEKTPEIFSQEQSHASPWEDSKGKTLLSANTELECPPGCLQSQLAEPTLTSGHVSGNHNTTFISSGQVVNFSGDVIVVYVGPTSLGSDGAPSDDDFSSPVQEQANVTAPFFQSSERSEGNCVTQKALRGKTQEMTA
ncbi:tumor necrosis factor receptor superfamily member 11A [Corythoichthys intestinalis]|uniref:tumor necrosis factor receptor superfamily member 11A n=1 Tax=Corythoichthys intestinalis TaxID=161448 RepID=UPI0025A68063|nr:tumor necrosis factor receptor superfamily member 11A [Corythoichthys intestinalis]XP_061810180.1 tumor necrosis factor receptor superfamily member 11A-like [Nerophis lumbriciformis]